MPTAMVPNEALPQGDPASGSREDRAVLGWRSASPPACHALTAAAALATFGAGDSGLTAAEAAERWAVVGPNTLPRPRRAGPLRLYARQFKNPLVYLLLGATLVSLGVGELADAAFIFIVLQFNAVIGALQEW